MAGTLAAKVSSKGFSYTSSSGKGDEVDPFFPFFAFLPFVGARSHSSSGSVLTCVCCSKLVGSRLDSLAMSSLPACSDIFTSRANSVPVIGGREEESTAGTWELSGSSTASVAPFFPFLPFLPFFDVDWMAHSSSGSSCTGASEAGASAMNGEA